MIVALIRQSRMLHASLVTETVAACGMLSMMKCSCWFLAQFRAASLASKDNFYGKDRKQLQICWSGYPTTKNRHLTTDALEQHGSLKQLGSFESQQSTPLVEVEPFTVR